MQPTHYYTVEEYLALEATAETRHEYWNGQLHAMAGADPVHNRIKTNLVIALGTRKHPCYLASADQRVQIGCLYVYPDIVLVCETPVYVGPKPMSLLNPELIVEVVSASTAYQDHHTKMQAYLGLDSLKEYWIVRQDEPVITRIARREEHWLLQPLHGLDQTLRSEHFEVEIPLAEVFALVTFPEKPPVGFTA